MTVFIHSDGFHKDNLFKYTMDFDHLCFLDSLLPLPPMSILPFPRQFCFYFHVRWTYIWKRDYLFEFGLFLLIYDEVSLYSFSCKQHNFGFFCGWIKLYVVYITHCLLTYTGRHLGWSQQLTVVIVLQYIRICRSL